MEHPTTPRRACHVLAPRSLKPSSAHKNKELSPVAFPPPVFKNFCAELESSLPTNLCSSEDDPFVSSSTTTNEKTRKLSATADPFFSCLPSSFPKLSVVTDFKISSRASTPSSPSTPSTMSERTLQEPESSEDKPWNGIFDHVYPIGEFTGDKFSRYPKISGVSKTLTVKAIKGMIKCKTFAPPERIISINRLRHDGVIVLQFANIRDAVNAGGEIQYFNDAWKIESYLNAREFSKLLEDRVGPLWSPYKGHLAIIGTWHGREKFDALQITDYVVTMMKQHGAVLAWEQLKTTTRQVFVHMEYYNIHDSERAKMILNKFQDGDLEFSVKDYVPDFEKHAMPIGVASDYRTELNEALNTAVRAYTFGETTFVPSPSGRPSSSASTVSALAAPATYADIVRGSPSSMGATYASVLRGIPSPSRAPMVSSSTVRASTSSNKAPIASSSTIVRPSSSASKTPVISASNALVLSSASTSPVASVSTVRPSSPSTRDPVVSSSIVLASSSAGAILTGSSSDAFMPRSIEDAVVSRSSTNRASTSAGRAYAGPSSDVRASSATSRALVLSSSNVGNLSSSGYNMVGVAAGELNTFSNPSTTFGNYQQAPMSFGMNYENTSNFETLQGPPMSTQSFGTLPYSANSFVPNQPRYVPFPVPNYGHNWHGTSGFGSQFLDPLLETMSRYPTGYVPMQERTMVPTSQRDAFNNHNIGANNSISLERINRGLDVRTTVMVRNIPNKMHQPELKRLVDSTSLGEYDFMYLRIDFGNNCNVGYAFINFVDPESVAKFVRARQGRVWPDYQSDKVALICYATNQGRDCLVQKFRNSSVMLEDPSFRPKLFHTGEGPMAGREEIFPGPDNDSKLRRSIENAGAVGLFAPNASQNFRNNQRRRRSRFDRGNHFAQREEEGYGSDPRSYEDYYGPSMSYTQYPPQPQGDWDHLQ